MRGARYDRILAGTALTLVLTFASAHAQPDPERGMRVTRQPAMVDGEADAVNVRARNRGGD